MTLDKKKVFVPSYRMNGYDYSLPGWYYVTVCTEEMQCVFGEVKDGQMWLNEWGRVVESEWKKSSEIRREIELDEFVVMPNHIHGIVVIKSNNPNVVDGSGRTHLQKLNAYLKPRSLGSFMCGFKGSTTKQINHLRKTPSKSLWQRNYYDHIIRNEQDYLRIKKYIHDNPKRWEMKRKEKELI